MKGTIFSIDIGSESHQWPFPYEDCKNCGGITYVTIEQEQGEPRESCYVLVRVCVSCGFAGDGSLADLYIQTVADREKVH